MATEIVSINLKTFQNNSIVCVQTPVPMTDMHISTFTPLRREDTALLTGRGKYTGDVRVSSTLHAVFVR